MMPRVIVKCRYYKSAKTTRNLGGLLKYIATREGVEKLPDGWKNEPASKAQMSVISEYCKSRNDYKRWDEYNEYAKSKTKSTASELISAIVERNPSMLTDKTYLDYIATRPRVERVAGKHGLFTTEGVAIDLEKEAESIRNYDGNVYTVIVSLKRDDAERLGFNDANNWRYLLQSHIDEVAREHGIPTSALKWFGAFHNESHHPHIHLILYSTDKYEKGYLKSEGIDKLRHLFGTEIFADDLKNIYNDQTEYRNRLNSDARDEISKLAEQIQNGLADNREFAVKFVTLAKRLQTVSGKKVYGYLPKNVKAMVNELVDILEQDEDISKAYELWYKAKCAVYGTYTDKAPQKKPLSQEEVFKPIRNAIIKEADELGKLLMTGHGDDEEPTEEVSGDALDIFTSEQQSQDASDSSSDESASDSKGTNTAKGKKPHKPNSGYITTTLTRLGKNLSQIFSDRFNEQANKTLTSVDSRLWRELEAKKKGQNISM